VSAERRRAVSAAAALCFVTAPAGAQDGSSPIREEPAGTRGMAEFGVGFLTLPGAEVCASDRPNTPCGRGDASFALSAWPLFRRGNFAAGAGLTLGLTSSTDEPRNDPPDVPRDHSRRYFSVEITGRYYIPITDSLEGWVGIRSGLGVVNDTFQSQQGLTDQALVGARGITILTQGYTVGAGAGIGAPIAQNWLVGGRVGFANWFLPGTPATDPFGDTASLKGVVTTVEFGVTLAYRSRLIF
jgi:hypothetical protein